MKTNKLIIYAAIGIGLWLLFRRKGNPITGKPEVLYGITPEMVDGQWLYPVPTLHDGQTHYMTHDEAKNYLDKISDGKLY